MTSRTWLLAVWIRAVWSAADEGKAVSCMHRFLVVYIVMERRVHDTCHIEVDPKQ